MQGKVRQTLFDVIGLFWFGADDLWPQSVVIDRLLRIFDLGESACDRCHDILDFGSHNKIINLRTWLKFWSHF